MAKPGPDPEVQALVRDGRIPCRVAPKARRNSWCVEGDLLRISVTAAPESGKANAAVVKLLSQALGVAKSRITLTRGGTSRDKVFSVDMPGTDGR